MLDTRPVLVGQNNPLSADPACALLPYPSRSAGYRLWRMVHEVCGMWRREFCDAYDRRNVLNSQEWIPWAAELSGRRLVAELHGRTILVLGHEARRALGLPEVEFCTLQEWPGGGWWRWMPHPSGRSHWYNTPAHRRLIGLLLKELVHGSEASV